MHRFVIRAVNAARKSSLGVPKSCVLISKCDKTVTPGFGIDNGSRVRAFITTAGRHCEKKNDVSPSNQEDKITTATEDDPKETSTVLTQKEANDSTVCTAPEQSEHPVVLKTDNGRATQQQQQQQQMDVKFEEAIETTKQVKSPDGKSSKEDLLSILGTMKVDVTRKRRLKDLKARQSTEIAPKTMPAAMESTISMFQNATEEAASQSELDPELVAAASAAASTLPNKSQATSELLRRLRENEVVTEAQRKGNTNKLGVIIADMKVGRSYNRKNGRPSNQIRFDEDGKEYVQERGITAELDGVRRRKNLLSGRRLNIFSPATDKNAMETTAALPTLWDVDFAHQLSLSTNQMPRNGLEELIQLTKEGKLWQYPVNNEAGLEEEAQVLFHEHVFLDQHLEEGFPRQGPVRHFMELVVAGLSRNPYLTVQQKKEHISWFRDYFHQKEEVLKEADVYLS
ncbi:small ribosomal subunit protein mS31 [Halichoeres trimaculatus]|uniref:small ribosomal subunit protein mS31 n=1 Tax=Halichoeres trimaculatus TaxID=147232 RepID=UPI003D9DB6CB